MKSLLPYLLLIFVFCGYSQEKDIPVEGVLMDASNYTVPYASISFVAKAKGAISNEDGAFTLMVKKMELNDTIVINCLSYEPFKTKIQDYLDKKEKVIVLKENITSLDEVKLFAPKDYVKKALKALKENTVSDRHQLTLLYRRASSEDNKARFFIEHYMKIIDRGPSTLNIGTMEVLQSRKSADYRFLKKAENRHSIIPMTIRNPLRQYMPINKITWKKTGDSSYGDEDVVIIEGKPKNSGAFKLYIGVDTYSVYKVENKVNNAIYIYKKTNQGKLYLSYHSRQWKMKETISADLQRQLGKNSKKVNAEYKHEVFVLDIETNKKKFDAKYQEKVPITDMAKLEIPYDADFWRNFVAPPDTKYFKKIKSELESNYGVPLKAQFLYSNK